jgi:hypothetical protein
MSAWLGVVLVGLAVPVAALWAFVMGIRYTDAKTNQARAEAANEADRLARDIAAIRAQLGSQPP